MIREKMEIKTFSVIAFNRPNADRLERRPLVPIGRKAGIIMVLKNIKLGCRMKEHGKWEGNK